MGGEHIFEHAGAGEDGAVGFLAGERPREVLVGGGHHEISLAGVAAFEGELSAVVAHGEGVVGEHVVDFVAVFHGGHDVSNLAHEFHLSLIVRSDVERHISLEILLLPVGGSGVAGPCLGHIRAGEERHGVGWQLGGAYILAHDLAVLRNPHQQAFAKVVDGGGARCGLYLDVGVDRGLDHERAFARESLTVVGASDCCDSGERRNEKIFEILHDLSALEFDGF